MMLQFSLAVSSYGPAPRRSIDLSELRTHVLKIFNEMATQIRSDAHVKGAPPDDVPAAQFLFGGYSWIKKDFELWKIKFDKTQKRFTSSEADWAYLNPQRRGFKIGKLAKAEQETALGRIAFAGDQAPFQRPLVDHRYEAKVVGLDDPGINWNRWRDRMPVH